MTRTPDAMDLLNRQAVEQFEREALFITREPVNGYQVTAGTSRRSVDVAMVTEYQMQGDITFRVATDAEGFVGFMQRQEGNR